MFKFRKPDDQPAASETTPPGAAPADTSDHPVNSPTGPDARSDTARPDNGLGVPPYRPATPMPGAGTASPAALKEPSSMSRPPFPAQPVPVPAAPTSPGLLPGARPGAAAAATAPVRPAAREVAERRTLVVARGISVAGVITDAERVVVEGVIEAATLRATEVSIAPGGVFKGEVEVEDAEIAGTIDGTVTARGSLVVRNTGRVLGTAHCRRLQVEDGGQITGRIEMITEPTLARAEV